MSSDSDELMVDGVNVVHSAQLGGAVDSAPVASDPDDDDIELMMPDAHDFPRIRRRKRSRPPLVTTGRFWTLVVEVHVGRGEGTERVHGVAEVSWRLETQGDGDCGSIEYAADQWHFLQTVAEVPHPRTSPFFQATAMHICADQPLQMPDSASSSSSSPTTVRAYTTAQGGSIQAVMALSSSELESLRNAPSGSPCRIRTTPVHKRNESAGAVQGHPDANVLRRWRAQRRSNIELAVSAPPRVAPSHDDVLPDLSIPEGFTEEQPSAGRRRSYQNLPNKPKGGVDPIRLVHAISFASHLRSTKYFTEALDEADAYLGLDQTTRLDRDRSLDPSQKTLLKSAARADAVCCLLQRRLFTAWFDAGCIKCICIYSDASPVAGAEIQGMVIDVMFVDGGFERIILPGTTLAYGLADTVSKAVALLWAIFLIAGPTPQALRTFCGLVSSLTTDFGVEMHLLEMPDIIDAFIEWVAGSPLVRLRPLVNQDTRLFHRALRMAGWSHTLGGIMKEVANSMREWPHMLGQMRILCQHFRNKTYREHIYRRLRDIYVGALSLYSLTEHFNASFAKWRYETVPHVQSQLLPRRELCQRFLDFALFAQAQDKEGIKAWMRACRDEEFWQWTAATYPHLFAPLEQARHWGMVCECPDHVAERVRTHGKKLIKCPRIINQYFNNMTTVFRRFSVWGFS